MQRRVLIAVAGVLLVTAAGVFVIWHFTRRAITSVVERKEQTVDLTALVTQVRELNRLETATMHVLHVSTITQSYDLVPNSVAGDELTFLAAGDVIAGVDLALLQKKDVWREGDGTIVMRLPPPQVLVTRIDNRESRVLSRKTGVLRRADVNLESRARQHAEQGIRSEAVKKGILNLAGQNSEKRLADFLHALGFTKVRFVTGRIPRDEG